MARAGGASAVTLRRARADDAEPIAAIWNHEVLETDHTTDTEPRDVGAQRGWLLAHGDDHPVIVAASGVFTWILTISGVPQFLADTIEALQAPQWGVLVAMNVLLIIVGCLIDPTSATLVLTPLLLQLVKAVGVDPVHFGIILTVNLSMGMFTPPFGLNIFLAQSLFGVTTTQIYPGLVPFILIQLVALAIITYVPEVSLFLTRLL
jgi:C4-dicarboxylate transporter DctM subunit